jgi:hypothetical protein
MKKLSFTTVLLVLLTSASMDIDIHAQSANSTPDFQIVESVPQATIYGEPGVPRTGDVWLEMVKGAKLSIDIAAFYITDQKGSLFTPVLDALVEQAGAGVKIHLLVDETFLKNDHAEVDRLKSISGIEVRVLPVDKLTGGVLHAKYMIVDGETVFVGSQNWDWRALDQIQKLARESEIRASLRPSQQSSISIGTLRPIPTFQRQLRQPLGRQRLRQPLLKTPSF